MRILSSPEARELLRDRILEVLEEGPAYSGDLAWDITTEVLYVLNELSDEDGPLGPYEEEA